MKHTGKLSMFDSRWFQRFPRAAAYNEAWVLAGISGAAHPLILAEWLAEAMELKPGQRVLDLGCGRGLSSIFLHREFGVSVWAADLWFSATEKQQRIHDAGVAEHVFPLQVDARSLPFASAFFDAIVALDSYPYYGTDDLYLAYLARFLRVGGQLGIAGAGLMQEMPSPVAEPLRAWWTPDLWCLHSADWWHDHWNKTQIVRVERADTLSDGWQLWLDWLRIISPENTIEINAITADAGRYMGYVRVVGQRTALPLADPIHAIPMEYAAKPMLVSAR